MKDLYSSSMVDGYWWGPAREMYIRRAVERMALDPRSI